MHVDGEVVPVPVSRRLFMANTAAVASATVGFLPLLRMLPAEALQAEGGVREGVAGEAGDMDEARFFEPHQWAVVVEATARLIPGPGDDPAETTAGAREAGVVRYIDRMLAAFDDDPPLIFTGGPWSDRRGGETNHFSTFLPLAPWEEKMWRDRIAELKDRYRKGIVELDQAAGGDFTSIPHERMDAVLVTDTPSKFRRVLFEHAVEGMYGLPEYGGNRSLSGWASIGWAGDVAPRGWEPDKVSASDGSDPVPPGFEMPFPAQIIEGPSPEGSSPEGPS